jgi:hypothetical protein
VQSPPRRASLRRRKRVFGSSSRSSATSATAIRYPGASRGLARRCWRRAGSAMPPRCWPRRSLSPRAAPIRAASRAHTQLGYLALKQGAPGTARRHWRTAIDLAWRVQNRAHLLITLDALIGLATIVANWNDLERAVELLALVRSAATIDRHTETRAEQALAELKARLSPASFAAAQARGRALELGATVAAVLVEAAV